MEIKDFRLKMGWTQTELGTRLGVHWTTVARWEAGETTPSDLTRYKIDKLMKENAADD